MRTSNRSSRAQQLSLAALLLAVVLLGLNFLQAAPAVAADGATVSISPEEQTKASGNEFDYVLSYGCSAVGAPDPGEDLNCKNTFITISLAELVAAGFTDAEISSMIGLPDETEWSVVDGVLTISLGDIEAGASSTIPLTITPPNNVTPNGTTWTMEPEISGDNFPTSTSSNSSTSTVTSEAHHQISKTLDGSGFRNPGEQVEYDLVVGCSQPASGNILLETMTVTDKLPDGLTFISSTPAPTSSDSEATYWELDPLPASCSDPGGSGTATIRVTAQVDNPVPEGVDQLTNTASVSSTTIDGRDVEEVNDTADVTVITGETPGPGQFGKASFAQLRDQNSTGAQEEANSHTTYPGEWVPVQDTQPAGVLSNFRPNEATGMTQSGYKMEYNSGAPQGSGTVVQIVDPVPCLAEDEGSVYHTSNEPGDLCQDPAFIVTTVSVWSSSAGISELSSSYRPEATLANGDIIYLDPVGESGRNAQTYGVPAGLSSPVAEIFFRDATGLSGQYIRWAVFGYASPQTTHLDVIENTAYATAVWNDQLVGDFEDSAEIYIVESPQTGIDKDFVDQSGGDATLRLAANLVTPSTAEQYDTVVTDLLPAGMTVVDVPDVITATVTENGADPVESPADSIEVIENFANSGRTLIRVTWRASTHSDFEGSIGLKSVMEFGIQVRDDVPGVYDNTAQIFYNNPDLLDSCQQSQNNVQSSEDPLDLDGSGNTTERHCWATDTLEIAPEPGSASFQSTKTVQGHQDTAPQSFPGIGTVGTEGGSVRFDLGWQNTGATTLSNAVTYDLFPRPGDTGVGGSSAGVPRGSEFSAVLVSVDAPGDVEVLYSLAENPCRDEVFPNADNAGCVDDWTTTAPADLTTVTGLKMVGTGPYAFGEGYAVVVNMTVPNSIDVGTIAWNSIAANAQLPDESWMQPSAPPKVGITAEALTMIGKRVVGDVSELRPGDEVTYEISATNPSALDTQLTMTDVLPEGMGFVSITPTGPEVSYDATSHEVRWEDQPLPARSALAWTLTTRLTESAHGEYVNHLTGEDVIPETSRCEENSDATCAAVYVDPGALVIAKSVAGEAASFGTGPFEFRVMCTIDGETVTDRRVTVGAGETSDPVEGPLGSECTVSEIDAGGATTAAPEQTVTLSSTDEVVTVAAENVFAAGYLAVEKSSTGVGAEKFGVADYDFGVACQFNGQQVYRETVTVSVLGADVAAASDPVGPLPVGADCTVTESNAGAADSVPDPIKVTIAAGTIESPQIAAFANSFSGGTVKVVKEMEGAAANQHAQTKFSFALTCQDESRRDIVKRELSVTGSGTVELTDADGEALILPAGTRCFVSETETGGANRVSIANDSYETAAVVQTGKPEAVQEISLTVKNTFNGQMAKTGGAALLATVIGAIVLLLAGSVAVIARQRRKG